MHADALEAADSTSKRAHLAVVGWRLLAIALQLAAGVVIAAVIFPFASLSTRLAMAQRWARGMIRASGVELRVEGDAAAPSALFVANHVSWIDVLALEAFAPAIFVAKLEVRHWPAIGWLAARVGTLFIKRNSGRSLLRVKNCMAEVLLSGRHAMVFPEGTTTDGTQVLPFRSGLLQAAVDAGCPVQPVALRYLEEEGGPSEAAAFVDGITLCQSIVSLCRSPRTIVHVCVVAPLASAGRTRKALAREARDVIAGVLARADQDSEQPALLAPSGSRAELPLHPAV
jgi:1-acyl-sn-glycerol-3-phosphate acyltransferase